MSEDRVNMSDKKIIQFPGSRKPPTREAGGGELVRMPSPGDVADRFAAQGDRSNDFFSLRYLELLAWIAQSDIHSEVFDRHNPQHVAEYGAHSPQQRRELFFSASREDVVKNPAFYAFLVDDVLKMEPDALNPAPVQSLSRDDARPAAAPNPPYDLSGLTRVVLPTILTIEPEQSGRAPHRRENGEFRAAQREKFGIAHTKAEWVFYATNAILAGVEVLPSTEKEMRRRVNLLSDDECRASFLSEISALELDANPVFWNILAQRVLNSES